MSNKVFIGLISVMIIGAFSFILVGREEKVDMPRLGVAHEDKGRQHVPAAASKPNVGTEPPTSGDHASSPLPWRIYDSEVPDGVVIHNLEHGGIYISYNPSLPKEEVEKIKKLFFQPYSRESFKPNKVILAPRASNESPIVMSSWTRSLEFDSFDEKKMVQYYLTNVGKSPEPTAG